MKKILSEGTTNRIDFLHASDMKMLQYLMFAGISYQIPSENRNAQEREASVIWQQYVEGLRNLLSGLHFDDLISREWYEKKGWRSSHYGTRRERPYTEIRQDIVELFHLVRTRNGLFLRNTLKELVTQLMKRLDAVLWTEGFKQYPPELLDSICYCLRKSPLYELAQTALAFTSNKERQV